LADGFGAKIDIKLTALLFFPVKKPASMLRRVGVESGGVESGAALRRCCVASVLSQVLRRC